MAHSIVEQARQYGIIGAGGAGFPTHVKLDSQAEYVIVNAAECEPLLQKDHELILQLPDLLVQGLSMAVGATGAAHGVVAVKEKHQQLVTTLRQALSGTGFALHLMGDFYPTGDEQVMVYEVTGRVVPPGGLPLHAGAVVQNVETLINLARQSPVTEKYVTIAGAVQAPGTFCVPIGTSFRDLLDLAGGVNVTPFAMLIGGAMMGEVSENLDDVVTKVTSGIIVLPHEHRLIRRKTLSHAQTRRIGQSGCDQCSDCTELCPRYLLGHPLFPHLVMRSLGFRGDQEALWSQHALLCCQCNLCTLYACPEDLDPGGICAHFRSQLQAAGTRPTSPDTAITPHPMREYRRVPTKKLIQRLGLAPYQADAAFRPVKVKPNRVSIPLQQGVGAAATPIVEIGRPVRVGKLLGEIPKGQLGSRIHASMSGTVEAVTDQAIVIVNR